MSTKNEVITKYKALSQFILTDLEEDIFEDLIKTASPRKTARNLKTNYTSVRSCIARVTKRAKKRNFNPEQGMDKPLPDNFMVERLTTHHKDGELVQYWTKGKADQENFLSKLEEAVAVLAEPIRGLAKPIKEPKNTLDDLMACYPIAEPHMGMYAWGEESGADYDATIAEDLLISSMMGLVDSAPNTERALLINLADYFHADNQSNKTEASGNVLDVDTRWGKVFQIGVRAHRKIIELALKKHKTVDIISGLGNHDKHSIFALMMVMKGYFHQEPRVNIHLPINPFAYYTYGKNLIGVHHGNGIKPNELPLIMAADRPQEWGEALYRTFFRGHIHHKDVKEHAGCTVESFRSIAAKDAWHSGSGYRALRAMECIVFKKEGGERGRNIVYV